MEIRCPKCDKKHIVEDGQVGSKLECSCSYKFVVDDYDFSRCICKSCGKRLNIEDLGAGERFECPFCKAQNIVGQNSVNAIQQNDVSTSATITGGGHSYSKDKNSDGSVPEIIGGCIIEKILGQGGMGRVYLAKHSNLDIPVALKTMLPNVEATKNYAERFFREARTAAKINHPNVVRVYDCGNENDTLFIVMEYVAGGTTGDLVRANGKLPFKTLINIAKNMCYALIEAQKFGIIHRDIKPDNIMCAEDGVYKLADLGLAKQISPDHVDTSLTMDSIGMGTPLYMPPEQAIDAKSCDIRSDIYSLGATLYHLACGKPPFESDSHLTLFKMHSEETPEPLSKLTDDLLEGFEQIIEKCMGKTPDSRYQDPVELLKDLKALSGGETIHFPNNPKQEKAEKWGNKSGVNSRKPLNILLIIVLICLPVFIVAAIFLFMLKNDKEEVSEMEDITSGSKQGFKKRNISSSKFSVGHNGGEKGEKITAVDASGHQEKDSVQTGNNGKVLAVDKTVVAVNPLSASGDFAKEEQIISDVMQAELSVSENITLVDRKNLQKALKELQFSEQGMISPESAKKLGKIVGAKYFCSGEITKNGAKTMAIVKIIDIETTVSKLAYATLSNKADAIEAGKTLAQNIDKLIANFTGEKAAIAKKIAEKNRVKAIPEDWKRPSVMVIIQEMHVRKRILIDPAAETELIKRLIADKFKVVDSEYVTMMRNDPSNANTIFKNKKTAAEFAAKKGVDILIYGEAISELGATLGEFEGCRGRVEIKAIKVDGSEILLADSAYGGATDLAETTAGKKAIQKAANKLADSLNYRLAEKWNKK